VIITAYGGGKSTGIMLLVLDTNMYKYTSRNSKNLKEVILTPEH